MKSRMLIGIGCLLVAGAIGLSNAWAAEAAKKEVTKPDGKPADMTKPVQVFIIMGQSNAVGMAKVASLEEAVKNKKYQYLVDDAGAWLDRKDVRYVQYMQGKGLLRNDWLTVKDAGTLGVEFAVGNILGNSIDAPVMILKSCIGNRALGWDLLPPSVGTYEVNGKKSPGYREYEDGGNILKYEKGVSKVIGTKGKDKGKPVDPWYAGKNYDEDTADAKKALEELDKHYPGAKSYEVAGFFWWQGEKDCGNDAWANNYEKNLVQLIKSLRKDFNAPNAKFVMGTLGESAKGCSGNGGKVLEAMMNVDGTSGKYPEFKGNVATVYTNPMAQGGSGNAHYGGKAEVYMDVGEAMGQAMVDLLKSK